MITAVDTSVLIDIFRNDPVFGKSSAEMVRQCLREGQVTACEIVWAELAAVFPSNKAFEAAMETLGVAFSPLTVESACLAGETWRRYRAHGGSRTRIIADFVIAAHAQQQCERLLTRDRGFCRGYFGKLSILDPTQGR